MLSKGIFLEHIYFFIDIIQLDAVCYAYIIISLDVEKKLRCTDCKLTDSDFLKSLTCCFRFWPIPIFFLLKNYTTNSR